MPHASDQLTAHEITILIVQFKWFQGKDLSSELREYMTNQFSQFSIVSGEYFNTLTYVKITKTFVALEYF